MTTTNQLRLVPLALIAAVSAAPFVLMFAPLGIVPLIWGCGILMTVDRRVRQRFSSVGLPGYALFFAAFGLIGAATAFLAPEPLHSLGVAARLVLTPLLLMIYLAASDTLDRDERNKLLTAAVVASVCHVVLVGLAGGVDGPLLQLTHHLSPKNLDDDKVRFNRGIAALSVLASPYIAVWCRCQDRKRLVLVIAFAAALIFAMLGVSSMAPKLALAAAISGGVLAWLGGKRGVWVIFAILLLLATILPFLLKAVYSTQWMQETLTHYMSWNIKHRLIVWQFAIERYFDQPWLGWGLEASRRLPGGSDNIPNVAGAEYMPLHPHNGFLQIWLELGVPGALALVGGLTALALRLTHRFARHPFWLALATAACCAYFAQSFVSYGVWQNWWIALAILAASLFSTAFRAAEECRAERQPS
ncbi:membrane hypothetical protein [Rhodospirillaceae bacterium LM-1]|nr:membrane hypothetical protein [Rhodospirillaceae bacterium LM-1]